MEKEQLPLLVETAKALMDHEFATLYGIEDLAHRLEITPPHLIRLFSRYIGLTPGKYLKNCRMEYARELLLYSDLSIKEIAALCGYQEGGYFGKVFRKHYGTTPQEYRLACRDTAAKAPDTLYIDEMYL